MIANQEEPPCPDPASMTFAEWVRYESSFDPTNDYELGYKQAMLDVRIALIQRYQPTDVSS